MKHTFLYPRWLFAMFFISFIFPGIVADAQQIITTVAGGIGNDFLAIPYARLRRPKYVVSDGGTNLYILDNDGAAIRRLNTATGIIESVDYGGRGVFDAMGNWYYASGSQHNVLRRSPSGDITIVAGNGSPFYSGDGGLATLAGLSVFDVAVDMSGNIYIADAYNNRVRKISTSGIITTIAGNGAVGYSGDGGPGVLASLNNPFSITVDGSGNVYFSDRLNNVVRKIAPSGIISHFAGGGVAPGDGGPAAIANVYNPITVRADPAGNIFIAQVYRGVRKVSPSGIISTVAGNGTTGSTGDGGPATAATFNVVGDVALDAVGNMYICDFNNDRLRKVNTSGIINTIAGNNIFPGPGFSGDGGNPLFAQFNGVSGLFSDGVGNLFVCDANNDRVRKISASGIITTMAGNGISGYFGDGGQATAAALDNPTDVVSDRFGNIYIAESGSNHIRRITPSGIITTFAGGGTGGLGDGGPATAATIGAGSISVDGTGNVYLADIVNRRVRKIDAVTNIITTIAGNGSAVVSGDGGPATTAGLAAVGRPVFDRNGNIFIGGNPIRKVDASGIITSLPASGSSIAIDTMGNVYISYGSTVRRLDKYNYLSVIGGTGIAGHTGDNGPALAARVNVGNISVDTLGRLFFSTTDAVRRICCLSNVIDRPPVYTRGSTDTIALCMSSGTISIDTIVRISDGDAGQTETWTIISAPLHGALGGFPYTATSTGGMITPAGLTYTPTVGYTGTDVFRIKVSDGEDTAMIVVSVFINPPPSAGTISGPFTVCELATITLSSSVSGGMWTSSNSSAAVGTSGVVTGITDGIDTITYTRTTACGTASTTRVITVNPLPYAFIAPGISSVCVSSSVILAGTYAGGAWSSMSPFVAIGSSTGTIVGLAPGAAIISYTFSNSCGTATDTTILNVQPVPAAATITGGLMACVGGSTTLSASVPGGTWSSSAPIIATVITSGVVTGAAAGAAFISYTVTNACGTSVAVALVNIVSSFTVPPIAGASSVCAGSTTALAHPTPGGTWSSSAAAIASVGSSGVVTGVAPGAATISYTLSLGCGLSVATTNVVVHTAAVAGSVTGPTAICTGVSNVMTATAPGGIWSSSNGNATISPAGIVTGMFVGTSVLTYTVSNSCGTAQAIHTINVYPSPVAGSILGPFSMCAGISASYSNIGGTPGGVWSSSNTTVATINPAGSCTALTAGTARISYTVSTGCSIVSATRVITVNVATAGSILGTTSLCAGGTSTLTGTVPGGIWNSSTLSVATITGTGVVNAISGGSSAISYTVTGMCGTITTTTAFIVGSLPVVSPITGTNSICLGSGSSVLSCATIGGVWSSTNAAVATVGSSGAVTGVGVGTTTISYLVTAGCGTTGVTMVFSVNGLPSAGVISGSNSVCAGGTTAFTASVPGGTWSSASPFIASVNTAGNVSGLSMGTATITYAVSNTCGGSLAMKDISVNVPNAGTITGLTTVCVGNGTLLTSTVPGGTWSSSTSSVASVSASGVVSGFAPGSSIVSYTVTDACGTAVVTTLITVSTLPLVSLIEGKSVICSGSTTALTNATVGGSWLSSDTAIATIDISGLVTGVSPGSCTISYMVTAGCGTAGSVMNMNIESMPMAGVISGSNTVCIDASTTLAVVVSGGVWTSNNAATAAVNSSGVVTGVKEGAAIISYSLTNSCGSDIATFGESVLAKPQAGIIMGKLNVCEHESVQLSASLAGGVWSSGNALAAGVDNNGLVTGLAEGAATVSYTRTNTCGSNSATILLNINPAPYTLPITGKSMVLIGKQVTLGNSIPGGVWYSSDSTVVSINKSGVAEALAWGDATITYTTANSNGCTGAVTHKLSVITTGIAVFGVYPNPASSGITISWQNSASSMADLLITDILGRKMITGSLDLPSTNGISHVDLSDLSDGVYTISVRSPDGDYVGRIVVAH